MSQLHLDAPLAPGEYLQCPACDATFGSGDSRSEDRCPVCEESWGFVKRKATPAKTVQARWGIAAHDGWWPVLGHLTKHARELGLDALDVGLMSAFGNYQHDPSKPTFPSFRTVAQGIGQGERTVRARVDKWVRLGLWEKHRRTRRDGGNTSIGLTHHGLTSVVEHMHRNVEAGLPVMSGVPELMSRLRRTPRHLLPHPPALAAASPGGSRRAEAVAVEAEEAEQEPVSSKQTRSDDRDDGRATIAQDLGKVRL